MAQPVAPVPQRCERQRAAARRRFTRRSAYRRRHHAVRGMTATTVLPTPGTANTSGGLPHSAVTIASPRPDSDSSSASRGRTSTSGDGSHTSTHKASENSFSTSRHAAASRPGTACLTAFPMSSDTTRQQSSASSGKPHRARTSAVCRRAHPAAVGVAANCCTPRYQPVGSSGPGAWQPRQSRRLHRNRDLVVEQIKAEGSSGPRSADWLRVPRDVVSPGHRQAATSRAVHDRIEPPHGSGFHPQLADGSPSGAPPWRAPGSGFGQVSERRGDVR